MIRLQVLKLVFWRTEPDGQNHGTTDGWTDRRGSRNSYLDTEEGVNSLAYKPVLRLPKSFCIFWNLLSILSLHAVFFIRNKPKSELVVFLILAKIFTSFCFLAVS